MLAISGFRLLNIKIKYRMSLSLAPLCYNLAADQAVTSSVVPVTITGFSTPIAINQRLQFEMWGIFTLGATGGFRFIINPPAGGASYNAIYDVEDLTTPASFRAAQSTAAAFTNASAVAATYQLLVKGSIRNGTTAGNVTFQFAQNNSTSNPITLLKGLSLVCFRFSSDGN